jgi:D-serine deaminase-like pyridoxal phosphate-dependent protein
LAGRGDVDLWDTGAHPRESMLKEGASDPEEGASNLEEGASNLEEGASDLEEGASNPEAGPSDLEEGASDLEEGASDLEEGASDLEEGASDLEEGASKSEEGASDLEEGASDLEAGPSDLEEGASNLEAGASDLEEGASDLEGGASEPERGAAIWLGSMGSLGYDAIRAMLEGETLPCVIVDRDAFDRNLERHLAILRPRGTPMRLATKSVRVPSLIRRVLAQDGVRGLMCFDVSEAELLAKEGFDDLLVAYPTLQPKKLEAFARLTAEGRNVSLAVDSEEGILALGRTGASRGAKVRAVLCLDMALEKMSGRVHLGVRRSPVRTPEQALALARLIRETRGVVLHGLLGYEAQVAGMGDDSPFQPAQNPVKRWIRRASASDVGERRVAIAEALRKDGFELALVNGGGAGSLDTTTPESGVTEVAAGSGLFKPHLFDYYKAPYMHEFEPAAFFALEVVRRPATRIVTCGGGGYIASGSVGPDKAPIPWLPPGLRLLPMEMAGEVQTPLEVQDGVPPPLGAPVIFRHAKAGELMERFREVLVVSGGTVAERAATYRGLGWCFM